MTDGGWIPAWRKLFDSGHWLAPNRRHPAGRREAWLDLCQMATHRPRKVHGELVNRGELVTSVRTLADRWGWSRSAVDRFLQALKDRAMLEVRVNAQCTRSETPSGTASGTAPFTVYKVVKYDTYAAIDLAGRDTERDTERDSSETAPRQEQEQNNSTRQLTLGASVGSALAALPQSPPKGADGRHRYPEVFERAWAEYPRRDGPNPKAGAYDAFRSRVARGADPEQLVIAAQHYRVDCCRREREGTEFVLQAATFFGRKGHWEQYLEPPKVNGTSPRREATVPIPGSAAVFVR